MTATVDFLGIGAHKAATWWLYHNLRQHPALWLPPRKELHYFDRSPLYLSPSHLAEDALGARLFGRDAHNREFRHELIRGILHELRSPDWSSARWAWRYFCGTYGDDWYASLFAGGQGRVKGEITPAYSILHLDDVQRIRGRFPDLKVIFLLRDPIERAWSHVRFDWKRVGFDRSDRQLDAIKSFIDGPDQALRSDYLRTLDIWQTCFSEKQIFVGFYDDVVHNPSSLLHSLFTFLGVPKITHSDTLHAKVNVSREVKMPPEILYYLAEKYYPDLTRLSARFPKPCADWLNKAERILGTDREEDSRPRPTSALVSPGL